MTVFRIFFFKQKTAYEMRISDWSSDVCSSDLVHFALAGAYPQDGAENIDFALPAEQGDDAAGVERRGVEIVQRRMLTDFLLHNPGKRQIGRASCRERVCQYV